MVTVEAIQIDASYRAEKDRTLFTFYGRAKDGRAVTATTDVYRPYLYVEQHSREDMFTFQRNQHVTRIEQEALWVGGERRPFMKIYTRQPFHVPSVRMYALKMGRLVGAADIPFHNRVAYDEDLGLFLRLTGEVLHADDNHIHMQLEAVERCEPFENPGITILGLDIENSTRTGKIYCCALVEYNTRTKEWRESIVENHYDSDSAFLELLTRIVRKRDPDVIAGYNHMGYDIPELLLRDEIASGGKASHLKLGRDDSIPKLREDSRRNITVCRITGRVVIDSWLAAREALKPSDESLENVCSLLKIGGKDPIDTSRIEEEWKRDKEAVMEYCVKDARLSIEVLLHPKVNALQAAMDTAVTSDLTLSDGADPRTSTRVDSLLIRECDRRKVFVPLNKSGQKKEEVEGGHVHKMIKGLHSNVAVLDFKAMYPTIFQKYNICFTTLTDNPLNAHRAPNGVYFLDASVRKGIVPAIQERLGKAREEAKAKSKEAGDYYDRMQNQYKELMNAHYGLFTSAYYRFTNPRIGAAITAFARQYIKGVIADLEREGFCVLGGDTDSVFVSFGDRCRTVQDVVDMGAALSKRYAAKGVTLEMEKVLSPWFNHGVKKKYVGKVVWPTDHGALHVRGYDMRRRDGFQLQKDALQELFDTLLRGENPTPVAVKYMKRLARRDVEKKDLVLSVRVRHPKTYEAPERLRQVQAALKLQAKGFQFNWNSRIAWIVTDASKTPQEVEPYIEGALEPDDIDWDYYKRSLLTRFVDVVSVFAPEDTDGYAWAYKKLGEFQASIFEFGGK